MSVENGGTILQLTVQWPNTMLDLNVLLAEELRSADHSKNAFSTFHPMYLAFENALRLMRERISDGIDSVASFPLSFAVETHINDICPL